MHASAQRGMTLIELMVGLAIGAFLMIGAIATFMQSRTTFRIAESVARLQENARFALDVLEREIRMAHYWGLTTATASIVNRAAPTAANGLGPDTCGNNWTIDLDRAIDGSNNSYGFRCAGTPPVETAADTLIVRRASEEPERTPLTGAATLRLQTLRGPGESRIFTGTAIPSGYAGSASATHRLVVNGYYVSRTSSATVPGVNVVPSLRVWTLLADGTMENQEVGVGVEDLQVQLGVDTDAPGTADRGAIDRYVDIGDALLDPRDTMFNPDATVLAVRIWLRVRADRSENGYRDTANYVYADQHVGPFNDAFRRLVVAKTIYLRNAQPSS
jgi:type IV pilus assembly protein PilW